MFDVTIWSEISGLSPKELGGPKASNFRRHFRQLLDFIANISGLQQDIGKQ